MKSGKYRQEPRPDASLQKAHAILHLGLQSSPARRPAISLYPSRRTPFVPYREGEAGHVRLVLDTPAPTLGYHRSQLFLRPSPSPFQGRVRPNDEYLP